MSASVAERVAREVVDAEAALDRCRFAEETARKFCQTAHARLAGAARRDLRAAQAATVAAERALTVALDGPRR